MNLIETLKPKPSKSVGHALRRGLVQAVLITGAFGASFVAVSSVTPDMVFPESNQAPAVQAEQTKAERQAAEAVALVDEKCKPYAEGTIPGHAVVALPGQGVRYVESGVGFDLWGPDEQYGTADDLPGTLYDFCR